VSTAIGAYSGDFSSRAALSGIADDVSEDDTWATHIEAHDDGETTGMRGSALPETAESVTPRPPHRPSRLSRGGGLALASALIAAVAVAATSITPPAPSAVRVVAEGTRSAFTFTRDQDASVLIRVPLDSRLRQDDAPPSPSDIPAFPASGPIRWASNIGRYYGWQLWIGGATGALQEEHCILLLRGNIAKGRCVVAELRRQSALLVSIPYLSVAADERPPGFGPGRRIGFWWFDDSTITVLLGNAPEEP
jgi:hypothetical protein